MEATCSSWRTLFCGVRPVFAAVTVIGIQLIAVRGDDVRKPVSAGTYYPSDRAELAAAVDAYLSESAAGEGELSARALIAPHAPYKVSGGLSGAGFARIPADTQRVVLLAPWHPRFEHLPEDHAAMRGIGSIPAKSAYRTPLGDVPLAAAAADLRARVSCLGSVEAAHFWEHGIEIQLPFLQRHLKAFTIVPILLDERADADAVAEALVDLVSDPGTVLVATAESAHAAPDAAATPDTAWIEHLLAGEAAALEADRFCGRAPVRVLLILAARLGWKAERVQPEGHAHAGMTCVVFSPDGESTSLLRASAAADWRDPETQEAFRSAVRASTRTNFQGDFLSSGEKLLLLDLARRSIADTLAEKPLPAAPLYSSTLARKLGCFVTLEKDGRLRGCIGNLNADEPLATAVQKNALRAAFKDGRFSPVTAAEMDDIRVEISVLTEPENITFRDGDDLLRQLEKGRHGVVITSGNRRATYLPQVWSQIPDEAAFLSHLCRKGGMPADTWRDPTKAVVQFYEVFAFGEKEKE